MLNKKLLKCILNVKHTIIDDVKMFDDDSIVFYVHPSKGQQCRCGICGRKSPYYDAGRGYRLCPDDEEHRQIKLINKGFAGFSKTSGTPFSAPFSEVDIKNHKLN